MPVVPGFDQVESSAHRGNRHGRSEAARIAVLEAADDLLVELGFAKLTMEAIATRAGVSKQTIYRWWKSKQDVLFDALLEDLQEELGPARSNEPAADLLSFLSALSTFLHDSDGGKVLLALLSQAHHDPQLMTKLTAQILSLHHQQLRTAVSRCLTANAEVLSNTISSLLWSQIYFNAIVGRLKLSDAELTKLIALLLPKQGSSPGLANG